MNTQSPKHSSTQVPKYLSTQVPKYPSTHLPKYPNTQLLRIALDGNEANVKNRVGSNVYAFQIISHLEKITRNQSNLSFTILLSNYALKDLPKERQGWKYKIISPRKFWTQWALPIHLFINQSKYDVFFTPSHYAPRVSAVPYISSVMDLAFLDYPEHFQHNDLLQLKAWTKYSVQNAQKIIAISNFTKNKIIEHYHRTTQDVVVAYPSLVFNKKSSLTEFDSFIKQNKIQQPYILYLGTIQPRKNIIKLIEAFEVFCRSTASQQLKTSKIRKIPTRASTQVLKYSSTQLVIAGKIGWMADDILERIKVSPFSKQIILTDFVPDSIKKPLYENALCSVLVGLYEGFGIPPLESLAVGTVPIVSNTSSLPEVVEEAGIQIDPNDAKSIAAAFTEVSRHTTKIKAIYKRKAREQVKKFSWENSAQIILKTILEVIQLHKPEMEK